MNIQPYPLAAKQWLAEKTDKKWVVWHGTQGRTRETPANGKPGRATTSIDDWNSKPDRVGAPYLVDRDGTIYKTFDDSEWIYHLGLKGTDGKYDRAAVGIEIANELGLSRDGEKLHAFDFNTPNTVYTGRYLSQDWRDYHYFADFDEPQIDATIELTLDICDRHKIKLHDLRLPPLLLGGGDHLSLQLPKGQDGSAAGGVGVGEDQGGGHRDRVVRG